MSDPGAIAAVGMALLADRAVCEVHKASGSGIAEEVAFAVLRGQQKRGNRVIVKAGTKR